MIKKKLGVLAAAVAAASSAHAAFFEQGNAVLFAYDSADNDTYFVDLGVSGQDLVDATSVNVTDSGLAGFLSSNAGAQWTVIASVNDTTLVGGPPAGASYSNSGVVSSSSSGSAVGTDGTTNNGQRLTLNAWLSDVQAASGGLSSFGVTGDLSVSSDAARNGGFFNNSLISVGSASALYYSQASPVDGTTLANPNVVSQVGTDGFILSAALLSSDGAFSTNNVSAVPVPAAAWLFGSALAGLTLARRRK